MAVTLKNIIASKFIEALQTTQYTSTNAKTSIDKVVVTNTSAANKAFSINIVTSGDVAGSNNLFIDNKILTPGEPYYCPEIVGQVLENGDFISAIADDGTSITIRASGREIV